MSIFKAALRVALSHPVYLLVYAVWLSAMGVFVTSGVAADTGQDEFESYTANIAVIDRDGSDLSRGLEDHLAERATLVEVEDNTLALQDAVATGLVECLFIVPDGFGEAYVNAARTGGDAPVVESVYSYQSMSGSLFDQDVNRCLSLVAAAAALNETADASSLVKQANEAAAHTASVDAVTSADAAAPTDQLAFYLQWSTYTLTAAIIVCVSLLMNSFNRTDVSRRNVSSPVSPLSYGLQMTLGCLSVTLMIGGFSIGLGIAVFGSSLGSVPPAGIALMLGASLAFSLVPLGIGFLLGQIGTSEPIANAAGNVLGLLMAFLGGAWVSLDLLAPEVQVAAYFTPASWFNDAVSRALRLDAVSWDAISPILGDIGIVLLFASVLIAAGLVAGKLRASSSRAGGNAAAARA